MNSKIIPSQFHTLEADYKGPHFKLEKETRDSIKKKLEKLYGKIKTMRIMSEFERIIAVYYAHKTDKMLHWEKEINPEERFSEKDAILITYGDLIKNGHEKPLVTMARICETYLKNVFNTIHILPFFPYSSDRGFAIMDFRQIDPNLGTWDTINRIHDSFKLMFDGVLNHISSKSYWFQEFLNGNPEYEGFFTAFDGDKKISDKILSKIMRPRTSSVLTEFFSYRGKKKVWTTFSSDQIDLNFQNPKVLLKMTEILLYYVRRGADMIRLDAVTYLWDELGTTGAHLWQTHTIIKLFRVILDAVAPHVALITETNVPHADNISYFGNGRDEGQMVYNFALPPMVLHTIQTGSSKKITQWAKTLKNPSEAATYFNFLDSHDGIGLLGVRGILSEEEINNMAKKCIEHGGLISNRIDHDGNESPYELNITSYSALNKDTSEEKIDLQVSRYIAARSIPLVLIGVPGVYLHGLFGSKNDIDAIKSGEEKRSINRNILNQDDLVKMMKYKKSTSYKVSSLLSHLIHKRINEKAFHPNGKQNVIHLSDSVFSVFRISPDGKDHILALTNITNQKVDLEIPLEIIGIFSLIWLDIINKKKYYVKNMKLIIKLTPYKVCWLKELIR